MGWVVASVVTLAALVVVVIVAVVNAIRNDPEEWW